MKLEIKMKRKGLKRGRRWFHVPCFEFQEGITLLLVILVLSALLTVGLGIFLLVFTELRISGELSNSFQALYAADQMLELVLYKDRVQQAVCGSGSPDSATPCYIACTSSVGSCPAAPPGATEDIFADFSSGACAKATVVRFQGATVVQSVGQYDCISGSIRTVRRSLQVTY